MRRGAKEEADRGRVCAAHDDPVSRIAAVTPPAHDQPVAGTSPPEQDQLARRDLPVRRVEEDPLAAGGRVQVQERATDPLVAFMPQYAQPRLGSANLLEECGGSIGRTIVEDEDLEWHTQPPRHGRVVNHCVADRTLFIERGDHDAEFRPCSGILRLVLLKPLGGQYWGQSDRLAALGASWLAISWALQNVYEAFYLAHWWTVLAFLVGVAAAVTLLRSGRWGPVLALLAAVSTGLMEHLSRPSKPESDTLAVVNAAWHLLTSGTDPYGPAIAASVPPGALFEYPPGVLALYGPLLELVHDGSIVERGSSMLLVLLLGALAWRVGPGRAALAAALYGTYIYGTIRALDQSDDTTLALLLAVGMLLLWQGERAGIRGGVAFWASVPVFALVVLFKQLAWPIYLFVALYLWFDRPGGRRHVVATAAIVTAAVLPFFVWGPAQFLAAMVVSVYPGHPNIYGINPLGTLNMVFPALATTLGPLNTFAQLGGLGLTLYLLLRHRSRDIRGALLQGMSALFAAIFLSRWTSPTYYMLLLELLCVLVATWALEPDRPQTDASPVTR